jgi:hypothetical protein
LFGFFATNKSHVLVPSPSNRNESEFSHLPRSSRCAPNKRAVGLAATVAAVVATAGPAVGTALAALTRMVTRKALIYAKESFIMTTSSIML